MAYVVLVKDGEEHLAAGRNDKGEETYSLDQAESDAKVRNERAAELGIADRGTYEVRGS